MNRYCEKCGNRIEPGDRFCTNCAAPVSAGRFCEECGKPAAEDDIFCSFCGSVLDLGSDIFCEKCGERLDEVTGRCPHCTDRKGKKGLRVNIVDKKVGTIKIKTLIRDIRFEAYPKDFILVLGSSGAGKTTLINAILGDGKANGQVILDGQDFYSNFKTMKSQIGLVPQFLILRDNDKVKSTLMDIAQIKLARYSKEEKEERVDQILEKLGIQKLENQLICSLSGGQKKKVSVAAQLVGYQKVFICDEPDSGLDAASRIQQMEILKDISETGKIVLVISHEPDDAFDRARGLYLFTQILVLAKSAVDNCGHLAYFGDPDRALDFFGVDKLQDIMLEINPVHEGGRGRADHYIQKFYRGM